MTIAVRDFAAFFAGVHGGMRPFGWQTRLLESVVGDGRWPDRIVAPTGAGKTVVLDVHVFAVALMAVGAGPRVPRRLALVVDRRALVDSQFDLARTLHWALRDDDRGAIVREVAAALASLRSDRRANADPLVVTSLRGGVPPSRRWVDDPTAAMVICATPAMWGSRLLFRGYGTGRLARPREAGLLAYDSVVVVDEAHLARQLVATARRIYALESMASDPLPVPRLQVVEATATADRTGGGRSVGVGDLAAVGESDVLARRLLTKKPVALVASAHWPPRAAGRRALARLMADQAEALLATHGRTVACIANTVSVALAVASEFRKRPRTVELLVGRMRPHDLASLRRRRPGLLTTAGDPDVDVVVATQTIEVGVDADFSAMVTELASGSAIVQRAGRVNRLGDRASAEVRVIVPDGAIGPKGAPPYDQIELDAALDWLRRRKVTSAGLAPWHVSEDPPPSATLRRVVLGRPEAADVRLLARTSERLFAEPDLELWLADDLEADRDVSVVVRAGLGGGTLADLALLRATPPRAAESFPASIATVRGLLQREGERAVYRWREEEVETLDPSDALRPGDVIVVDDGASWFTHGVIDPDGEEQVDDVLEAEREGEPFLLRIGPGMPFDAVTRGLVSGRVLTALGEILLETPDDGRVRRSAMVRVLEEASRRLEDTAEAGGARRRLAHAAALLRGRIADTDVVVGPLQDGGSPAWVVIADQRARHADEDVRQTWTGAGAATPLATHQDAVAARAREIAERLVLGAGIAQALHDAGALHDEGKRDPRFQQLLGAAEVGPSGAAPLAKSGRRSPADYRTAIAASGLPTGWRHEQLSAVAAWSDAAASRDLVVRLVGTSHGHGRSAFPHATARLIGQEHALAPASTLLHDEGRWDSIVEATHRSHGFWGCAFLEAILRAADGQVSGEADERT